jgi:hypothetical protein
VKDPKPSYDFLGSQRVLGLVVIAAMFLISALLYTIMLLLIRLPLTKPLAVAIGIRGKKVWLEFYTFTLLILNFVGIFIY